MTRGALNRVQRHYNATENAWGLSKGPVSSADLLSHERLDRPIIRVFQRHPGNNVPEAREILKVPCVMGFWLLLPWISKIGAQPQDWSSTEHP